MQSEHEARGFAREVYAGLGVTGKTPTQDDLDAIETWHEQGAGNELILLAVKAAHSKSGGGNMDDVDSYLQDWRRRGLTRRTPFARIRRERACSTASSAKFTRRRAWKSAPQRAGSRFALPLGGRNGHDAGADSACGGIRARGAGSPMMLIGRILRDWSRAGIATTEAARQEHESHLREAGRSAAGSTAPSGQGGFIKAQLHAG